MRTFCIIIEKDDGASGGEGEHISCARRRAGYSAWSHGTNAVACSPESLELSSRRPVSVRAYEVRGLGRAQVGRLPEAVPGVFSPSGTLFFRRTLHLGGA